MTEHNSWTGMQENYDYYESGHYELDREEARAEEEHALAEYRAEQDQCEHDGDRYEMVINGIFEWRCAQCGILTGAMPYDQPKGYPPYA